MTELLTGIGQVTELHLVNGLMVVLACVGQLDLARTGKGLFLTAMLAFGHGLWIMMSWFAIADSMGIWSQMLLPVVASVCVIWNINQASQRRGSGAGMFAMSVLMGLMLGMTIGSPISSAQGFGADMVADHFMFWLGIAIGLALLTAVVLSIGSLMRGFRISERDQGYLICGGVLFQCVVLLVQELL